MLRPVYRRALSRPAGRSLSHCFEPIPITVRPRIKSYTTAGSELQQPPAPATPPPPRPASDPTPPRPSRRLYYASVFLTLGIAAGTAFRLAIQPPELPAPASSEDLYLLAQIQTRGAALPIVQQLEADPEWTSWHAYSNSTRPSSSEPGAVDGETARVQARITSGPMSGSSGLAFQRIFRNPTTAEVISIIYFGPGLAGWPGVVHGGALATVLDESLGRCAILRFPSRTGVTANLELSYRGPTRTNKFHIIRTRPLVNPADDVVLADGTRRSDRKLWVEAILETEQGKTCVEAKGLFVVPKKIQLKPLDDGF